MLGERGWKLLTRRILVADILAPGEQIRFKIKITKDHLPSSEIRYFKLSDYHGRVDGQPEYLFQRIIYIAVEYSDIQKRKFHSVKAFLPRPALLQPSALAEMTDHQKFSSTEVEMKFFDRPHPENYHYDETKDEKKDKLKGIAPKSL
jgi:hypothetical protein